MIERALQSLLTGDNTVAGASADLTAQVTTYAPLLKGLVSDRIYQVQLPRNTGTMITEGMGTPSIWYGRSDTNSDQCHDGSLALTNAKVELHVVANDQDTADMIMMLVRKILDDWHGTAGPVAAAPPSPAAIPTIKVHRIWVSGKKDFMNDPIGAAEFGLAESMVELDCHYDEP